MRRVSENNFIKAAVAQTGAARSNRTDIPVNIARNEAVRENGSSQGIAIFIFSNNNNSDSSNELSGRWLRCRVDRLEAAMCGSVRRR